MVKHEFLNALTCPNCFVLKNSKEDYKMDLKFDKDLGRIHKLYKRNDCYLIFSALKYRSKVNHKKSVLLHDT
jgi:hypothetical protein